MEPGAPLFHSEQPIFSAKGRLIYVPSFVPAIRACIEGSCTPETLSPTKKDGGWDDEVHLAAASKDPNVVPQALLRPPPLAAPVEVERPIAVTPPPPPLDRKMPFTFDDCGDDIFPITISGGLDAQHSLSLEPFSHMEGSPRITDVDDESYKPTALQEFIHSCMLENEDGILGAW